MIHLQESGASLLEATYSTGPAGVIYSNKSRGRDMFLKIRQMHNMASLVPEGTLDVKWVFWRPVGGGHQTLLGKEENHLKRPETHNDTSKGNNLKKWYNRTHE